MAMDYSSATKPLLSQSAPKSSFSKPLSLSGKTLSSVQQQTAFTTQGFSGNAVEGGRPLSHSNQTSQTIFNWGDESAPQGGFDANADTAKFGKQSANY